MNPSIDRMIRRYRMLSKGDHVLVAVSGGVDSMVLLDYLSGQMKRFGIRVHVVHAHHHLRGADADADASLVRDFCHTHDIPFEQVDLDVTGERKLRKGSVQEIARDLRYEAFRHVMAEIGANRLALAHHGDDQVETVLIELLRTTGRAPAGMRPLRPFPPGTLIRPLLGLEKKELYAYADLHQVPYREDHTNEQETYTRNRIRHKLLPVMKEEEPAIHKQVQSFTEDRQLEEDFMEKETEARLKEPEVHLVQTEGKVTFSRSGFNALPSALQKRAVHLLLTYLFRNKASKGHWNSRNLMQAVSLIRGNKPNAKAYFEGDVILVCTYDQVNLEVEETSMDVLNTQVIPDEGNLLLPGGNLIIETAGELSEPALSLSETAIPAERLPLTVRSRKPGDRILLQNRKGRQKIKDLMINRKIPLHMRELWPIIVDRHDTILWVPELAVSGELTGQDPCRERIVLRFVPFDKA
ncbi:tRNA lysidine(34) synthetase TilS [Salisediminibacterium beveridgei]|uniref:tRNA(Ile)-lysidine synthase n=1 Tax=Salisediminibacterium beveridgei TaxID=632773 RepID=A0A1D7R025_9BACI|nr:tRNA lysidine(34) synthetase TilS [Salisediminibacterium beveridgei]AOM84611.1 tRNA(Ile)-lysidine synthetase [Salisediminibacterium beveridgei]